MMTGKPPDRVVIDAVLPDLRKQIGILDNAVARTGHLVEDRFTLADVNLLPTLDRIRLAPEGAEALAAAANLARYFETHSARPSFQRTSPPAGPPGGRKDDLTASASCSWRTDRMSNFGCGSLALD